MTRPRAAVQALVAALAVAGCASAPDPPPLTSVPPAGAPWTEIARDASGPVDPDSPNACRRGSADCIEAVAAEMTRRFDRLAAACDHRAAFSLMYLRVTEGVAEQGASIFDDPAYLNHLDAVFATLYFDAFDAWQAGRHADVPEAWRIAFRTAEAGSVSALGDMLIGMNAHISRDLPFALAASGLETPDVRSVKRDFDTVNGLLGRVQLPMLAEVAKRLDPTVSNANVPMLAAAPVDVAELISAWRTEAYENAERLIAARGQGERAEVARQIEQNAADRGNLIRTLTSYRLAGGTTKARDDYCRARVGG